MGPETKIKEIFSKKFPNKKVTKIVKWDNRRYVVVALEKEDELDPYYAYYPLTRSIMPFSPGEDIVKFAELMFDED